MSLEGPPGPKGAQGYAVPFSKFDPLSYFKAPIKWHMDIYHTCVYSSLCSSERNIHTCPLATIPSYGQAWPGHARLGQAWPGLARPGLARPGQARPGRARYTCKSAIQASQRTRNCHTFACICITCICTYRIPPLVKRGTGVTPVVKFLSLNYYTVLSGKSSEVQ